MDLGALFESAIKQFPPEVQAEARRRDELFKLIDERERCEASLYEFIRAAWPSIDGAPFQENWAVKAYCEHLEAVTYGDIPRLLCNFPPRCQKTLTTSVCWPAWVWAQSITGYLSGPQVKFLCGSYGERLSLDNSNLCRRLIMSPWYQRLWGHRFALRTDQNTKGQFDNTKNGSRIATSVGGSLLGLGGDIVCFPPSARVQTELGPVPIGDIVNHRLKLRVWSRNPGTGKLELKPIIGWHRNPGRRLVKITLSNGSVITPTYDHQLLTTGGYLEASLIVVGEKLFTAPSRVLVAAATVAFAKSQVQVSPNVTVADAAHGCGADTVFLGEDSGGVGVSRRNGADNILRKVRDAITKCAMLLAVGDVLRSGSVFKVVKSRVSSIAVFMAAFLPVWARPNECRRDHLVAEAVNIAVVSPHGDAGIAFVENGGHDLSANFVASTGPNSGKAFDAAKAGDHIKPFESNDISPELSIVASVEFLHGPPPLSTYCITVADFGNMCIDGGRSSYIVKNCVDDPHNVEEVESEDVRARTIRWWNEIHTSRLNSPIESAVVVVMQRLHASDVSGVILDSDEDWCHFCVPMVFDELQTRRCVTVVLPDSGTDVWREEPWRDEREDGDLMWPERFGPRQIDNLRRQGDWFWSGRYQQSPSPAGGGIIKREFWQPWDDVEARRYGLEWSGERREYPDIELVVASLDTAYGEKEENDYNALTVWGLWVDMNKNRRAMLMFSWAKRLPLHGRDTFIELLPGETKAEYEARKKEQWGLVEWIADTCVRYKVRRLLIEDKTRGRDVAQELRRLYDREHWGIELLGVCKDKVSRTHAEVSLFVDNVVWAPDTKWADEVITQCARFPKDEHDDLHDTVIQFLSWARESGLLLRGDEMSAAVMDEAMWRPHQETVAEVYGV